MTQLNIHLTSSFESNLRKFMKLRHIKTKSEAIRIAIKEGVERASAYSSPTNFSDWLGFANQVPVNKNVKFSSDNDLWK